jgi:phenylacetate-CoA ligase
MAWRKPFLLAALKLSRRTVWDELTFLRQLEWKSREEIADVHNERLQKLLVHAWRHCEYYREVLNGSGVVRNGQVFMDRFADVPILTKEIIRREGTRLRASVLPDGRRAYVNRTGGSTGEPVEYWQDNVYWDIDVATKLYHFEVLGKELGELEMKIWGSDRGIFQETATWKAKLQNFAYHRRALACSRLDDTQMQALIDEINAAKPKSIWSYIDGLYALAEYANRKGLKIRSPVAVFSGGGTLFPHMERAIETAFGAPAINFYGSREMGDVACDCGAKAGLHISSNSHKVEIVDRRGCPVLEEEGDIVLTSLHNYAMPFIRYKIGDRGKLTDRACLCGRGFPLLQSISGRQMESFLTKEGAIISPIYLITTVGTSLQSQLFKKFQIVQDDYDRVTLKVVACNGSAIGELRSHLDEVATRIRSVMGQDCEVAYDFVEEIPRTSSGKYLYTVTKVPHWAYSTERELG